MAVAVEGYAILLQNDLLDRHLPGGHKALRDLVPGMLLQDPYLTAVSFMAEDDAQQCVLEIGQACAPASLNTIDPVILSGVRELPERDWLSTGEWEGSLIAWRTGEEVNPLIAPEGWEPGKPRIEYCTTDDLEKMEFLGTKDGVETYRDPESGTLRYVSRPQSNAERLYDEAVALIAPFLKIVGREEPEVSEEEKTKSLRDGIDKLETILDTNPEAWASAWQLGKAHQALGNSPAAYDAFLRAYDLEHENPNVAREFMLECLNLGKIEKALEAATRAVELEPNNDGLVSNYALSLLFAGDYREALRVAKRAYKMERDPITKNLIGVIKEVKRGRRPQPKTMSDL